MQKAAMNLEGGANIVFLTSGVLDYLMEQEFYTVRIRRFNGSM